MRPSWKGHFRLSLVTIPVYTEKLQTLIEPRAEGEESAARRDRIPHLDPCFQRWLNAGQNCAQPLLPKEIFNDGT
jgi:non-homologous end joining protein Ku